MSASRVGLAFVVLVLLGSPAHSTTIVELCPDGEAVESLIVWEDWWLDRVGFTCTDGSEPDLIPPGQTGGSETTGVCEGSGGAAGGVESIEWYLGSGTSFFSGTSAVVYFNVTCLDGDIFAFADGTALDGWSPGEPIVQSCDEGEYVIGLSVEVEFLADDTEDDLINSVELVCSSSDITPAPTLAETPPPTPALVTTGQDDTPVSAIVGGVIGGALALGGLILLALCKTGRIRTGKQRGGPQYPVVRQHPQPIDH